jgi:D-arabinose 1-dehydrogenase-like Zn-dependent alcohol dehydrogenase
MSRRYAARLSHDIFAECILRVAQIEFEPKSFEANDVDIKVQFCGVCGSDLHTLSGGWV